jgi:membrane fusion protein (multidrug efflux system)
MRQALCTTPVIFALNYPALAQQQPVGVAEAESKPIARAGDFVGRVEALSRVGIRARITGYSPKYVRYSYATSAFEGEPL